MWEPISLMYLEYSSNAVSRVNARRECQIVRQMLSYTASEKQFAK